MIAASPATAGPTWHATAGWDSGRPQPALIAQISRHVFGRYWRSAACIAHYESTDGAHTVNGSSLSPWQINTTAHPWVDAYRVLRDWLYAARVAFRISAHGTRWSQAWVHTSRLCGIA